MTRLALLLLAAPLSAQSLFAPSVMDNHYVHLASKPVVSGGVYGVARLVKLSPNAATVVALAGPEAVSWVRTSINYPGHLPWQEAAGWHDAVADTFAASLSILLIRLHGWKRVVAVALWSIVEFPLGLNRLARP